MKLPDLQYLMHQLGPATPEILTIFQEGIDSWMIEFDEGVAIQIEWGERSGKVLMRCAIGQAAGGSRESVYASLLTANLVLTDVADVKLALSEVGDHVMLIGEYDLADASLDALRQKLFDFLGFAEKFSQFIASSFDGGLPGDVPADASIHRDRV